MKKREVDHVLRAAGYVAARRKDLVFNHQLAVRGLLDRDKLLQLLAVTAIDEETRSRIARAIALDFASAS